MDYAKLSDRELDAEVATKLFGRNVVAMDWPCENDHYCGDLQAIAFIKEDTLGSWQGTRGPVYLMDGHEAEWPPQFEDDGDGELFACVPVEVIPFYSTTWQGTGDVIEAMAKRGWRVTIEYDTDDAGAQFAHQVGHKLFDAFADKPPRAVAEAALSALTQEAG